MKKEDAKYILEAIEWMNANTTVASVDMETYGNLFMNSQCLLMDVVNGVEKSDTPALNLPVVINCKATTHELKTWIPYYKAVVGGVKQFEVRKDDRNFKEGDILHLREWDNTLKEYTGRDTKMGICYILKGGAFGVQKGYVIMGLCCL